jgi:integrative and conjugative element protein (TIGR02256 family)
MSGRLFRRAGGAVVKLDAAALTDLLRFRQSEFQRAEAGGVLLGRRILGSADVVIDEVTTPLEGDRRTRTTFHRAQARHQQVIDARWSESGGTCQYLGEWHTHPEPLPVPSLIDVLDWCRRLGEDRFDGESLFFLIIGTDDVRAWEGFRQPRVIVPLDPVLAEPPGGVTPAS